MPTVKTVRVCNSFQCIIEGVCVVEMELYMKRLVVKVAAVSLAVFALAGCSSEGSPTVEGETQAESSEVVEDSVIIDVRTPEEFAEGHLEGALNIDISDPGFEAAIDELDPNATYNLYCRSGNRAGQAQEYMEKKGFVSVTNLGSVDEAASTLGVSVVK